MKFSPLFSLVRHGQLKLLWQLGRMLTPLYRASFLSAAASSGLLRLLAAGPMPFERLAGKLAPDPSSGEALEAWLKIGVQLGELQVIKEGYGLRGKLARKLAAAENDPMAALLEEAVSLHYDLIRQLPFRLEKQRRFTLAEQDGQVIARSSRVLEPLVFKAIDSVIPKEGTLKLLEVGCGSGVYIRHAAERNPHLTAVGVELQPEVAEAARRNLEAWGLGQRAEIQVGDIRSSTPEALFDVVTLHNNIYYFPRESRPGLLAFLRGFLKPGGRLVLTTGCQGGSLIMAVLNLWGAATEGCGALPSPQEMVAHLRQGGFTAIRSVKLYPFDQYYAFVGTA